MYRTIYVLVYPSRLFAAHWSLWIPHLDADGQEREVGDRIHATGDRLHGFVYEYDCDYNMKTDDRKPIAFPIGRTLAQHVSANDKEQDADSSESHPVNDLDAACRKVPAPGPSLNKVSQPDNDHVTSGRPARTLVKDCQWWIGEVVPHLVSEGLLLPLDEGDDAASVIAKVKEVPRH
ncbi:hypothetical protein E8E14_013416 [Neopestalotiopsis sp. 37M]|nr:hypothetical protein E8E14_013416 [Neopestalotiopsis sp. 37M]